MAYNAHTIISNSFHRKIQLKDNDIHLLKTQVFAPIFYLVTTPSKCFMVYAGPSQQPYRSGLLYHVCTCTMEDYATNIFIHLRNQKTSLVLNLKKAYN